MEINPLRDNFMCDSRYRFVLYVTSRFFFTQHSLPNFGCVLDDSLTSADRTWTTGFLCFCLMRFFVMASNVVDTM